MQKLLRILSSGFMAAQISTDIKQWKIYDTVGVNSKMRIMIADGDKLIRSELKTLLSGKDMMLISSQMELQQ